MGEVIQWKPNKLGYDHVHCGVCEGEAFYIKVGYGKDSVPYWYSIICAACENEIFCDLQPVWGPREGGE